MIFVTVFLFCYNRIFIFHGTYDSKIITLIKKNTENENMLKGEHIFLQKNTKQDLLFHKEQ
jgi:hypothetical protein